ncbi:unnamed protein product [Nesidiocoris tenuis]|uniref:Uncharacterized protein n=1 Tax=Nesidiocoris tenuis TaxID=355587 RepID=A0A6H5HKP4_9HEMI|nr:unnamed protein product [Nesidiocoris tenuis]
MDLFPILYAFQFLHIGMRNTVTLLCVFELNSKQTGLVRSRNPLTSEITKFMNKIGLISDGSDAIAYEMSRSGEIASETRSFQLTVGGAGKRKMVEREKKPGKKKQRTAEQ